MMGSWKWSYWVASTREQLIAGEWTDGSGCRRSDSVRYGGLRWLWWNGMHGRGSVMLADCLFLHIFSKTGSLWL